MKKVLEWIVLVWTVLIIPTIFDLNAAEMFFAVLYIGLIVGILIDNLRKNK